MDQPAIDEGEVQARFVLTGAGSEPLRADAVAAVLAALQPAALIVGAGWDRGVMDVAHEHGVAVLIEDNVDLADGIDGVHLTDTGRVAEVRAALDRGGGDRLILGVDVGLSRHDAMVAGEKGADYVAFGERDGPLAPEIIEHIRWWRDVTILPCLPHAADAEAAKTLADIGADFIGVSAAIWGHPEGPAAAAEAMAAAIEKT
ncbi:MAG: thiamine phosphate synthase [Alphaproteobacteria bacterium]|nr:thiamine phosphate synthase [Alphaproteobacteria bacterium]